MAVTPFTVQPRLVAISGMYRNARLIADEVLPRVDIGGTQTYKYLRHTKEDGFTLPDTRVGRTSRPNQLQTSAIEVPGATNDFAIDIGVPNADKQNAQGQADAVARSVTDPQAKATRVGTDIILLDREVRVAAKVHALATYPSANRTTLSGTSQWSDYTNSNPVDAILAAMDIPMATPNVGVMGRAAFTKLRQHPKVVAGVLGNAGTSGVVSAQALADLLGLQKLLIGEGWLNTARPGQAVTMSRVWGKHMALLYLDPNGGPMDMPSFGWTAEWGTRQSGSVEDGHMGARGGEWIRTYESVDEQIAANDMGYLFRDCVA